MEIKKPKKSHEILIGKRDLHIKDLVDIARNGAKIRLTRVAESRIRRARTLIEKWVQEGKVIYGK